MQSKRAAEPVINLPKGVCELLNSCPKEGSGVHSWLFKTALPASSLSFRRRDRRGAQREVELREARTGDL